MNLTIFTVVIICNVVKAAVMLFVAFYLAGRPLTTIDDAVQSFLKDPDQTTKNMYLLSKHDVLKKKDWPLTDPATKDKGRRKLASPEVHSWRHTITNRRWRLFLLTFSAALLIVVVLSFYESGAHSHVCCRRTK